MRKVINIPWAPKPIGPYSQAIKYNNTLYVSGQIPVNPMSGEMVTGDISAQTIQVFENISALLKAGGMDFTHIIKTSVFLADMDDFGKVNEIYSTYFTGNYPARETVQVARLPKDSKIEISVIAVE